MPFTKPNKGSVLVFSLIVLSIVLSAALSVTVVNVSNRKSAGSTGQSVQSFQVADSGVEKALKEIYKGSYTDLNAMRASITGSTACSGGKFSFPVSGGSSTVTFFDADNTIIDCASTTWRDDVAKIKVEGTSVGTTRVIETAVAAPIGTFGGAYTAPSPGYPANKRDNPVTGGQSCPSGYTDLYMGHFCETVVTMGTGCYLHLCIKP